MHDIALIGGGFFGCSLATHIAARGERVVVIEREKGFLRRASYANQARVHNGYHYPRSLLTALRSRVNSPRFRAEYADCIYDTFDHYYAVPRRFTKVNAAQFRGFMERIGAAIHPAPDAARKLFESREIEDVFTVEECAFDAAKLARIVGNRLEDAGVDVLTGVEIAAIHRNASGFELIPESGPPIQAGRVLNCTYSRINHLLRAASLPPVKLKHEITEMALTEPLAGLETKAFTVMCGPFFSFMPFPALGLHTLSHVRYTPHCSWVEGAGADDQDPYQIFDAHPKRSRFEHMRRDAARFLPPLAGLRQQGSIWEIKTVLPQSEADDSRPILFRQAEGEPRFWSIMGGKIDNIYDAMDEWDALSRPSAPALCS